MSPCFSVFDYTHGPVQPSAAWYASRPTPDELDAVLGPRWAICASSKSNMLRFGKCITLKYYEQVCRQIMEGRKHAT